MKRDIITPVAIGVIGTIIALVAVQYTAMSIWADAVAVMAAFVIFTLTSYIVYDVRGFAHGIKRAWREVRNPWLYRKLMYEAAFVGQVIGYTSVATVVMAAMLTLMGSVMHAELLWPLTNVSDLLVPPLILGGVASLFMIVVNLLDRYSLQLPAKRRAVRYRQLVQQTPTLVHSAVRECGKTLGFMVCHLHTPFVGLARFLARFAKRAFLYVHCDGRRAWATDTAVTFTVGVGVGFTYDVVLYAALVAFVVGTVLAWLGRHVYWHIAATTG